MEEGRGAGERLGHLTEPGSRRWRAIAIQIATASLGAWLAVLILAPVLSWTLGVSFPRGVARASFIVGIILLGAGAASIRGGVVSTRPLGPMHHWWKPTERDGVPELDAPLTLLGTALFVVPQMVAAGIALYE